jgi:hypothetical protein
VKQRLPVIALAFVLAALLALIATGAIVDVVVTPLLFLWWVARVLYEALPQALLWGAFVAIAVLLVAKSLTWSLAPLPPAEPQADTRGRVSTWSELLRESSRDDHGRWRLAQRLSQLAIEMLAFREQCPPHEISRRLDNGSLDLPPDLRAYLRAGISPYAPRPKQRRRFGQPAQQPARPDPLASDPNVVIDYLESALQRTIGES